MAPIRAVLFDLDGLLANTEELHSEAWRRTLAEQGLPITKEEYAELWIRRGWGISEVLEHLGREGRLPPDRKVDREALLERKDEIFRRLAEGRLRLLPGAKELLEELSRGGVRLGLVSSARRNAVEFVLQKLDLRRYFDVVIAQEDTPRTKPHPDPFLRAAQELGVRPEECVVIEDAEKGVIAARRAGMRVIAVPNGFTRDNDFAQAELVVPSLKELSWGRIRSLA
jgi:beta-phosphoglucomutase family hydrolase